MRIDCKIAPESLPALAQARSALMLLYEGVLDINLGELSPGRMVCSS